MYSLDSRDLSLNIYKHAKLVLRFCKRNKKESQKEQLFDQLIELHQSAKKAIPNYNSEQVEALIIEIEEIINERK